MFPRTDLRTTGASDRSASARFCCPLPAAADEDATSIEDGDEDAKDEEVEGEAEDAPVAEVVMPGVIDEVVLAARAFNRCALTEREKVPDPGSTPSGSEAAISLPYFFFGAIDKGVTGTRTHATQTATAQRSTYT